MIVYKTTNLLNGFIYIGKACGRNITRAYFGSGTYLRRAINKYGKNNFHRIIIDKADNREEQNLKEQFWISFYRDKFCDMYNIAPGGEGTGAGRHSEQTKRKISAAHKGMFVSEETKRKLSLSHLGIKQSADTIRKRIEKTKGMKRTIETRLKMSISQKGNSNAKGKSSKHKGKTWIVENGKRLWKEVEIR